MVLGLELGSIYSGKAKQNLAKKKCGTWLGKPPRMANPVGQGVANCHAFLKEIIGCVAVRHAVL